MQVEKWGDGLAVRLPKKLVDEMRLRPGDELEVVKAEGCEITVEKVDRREQFLEAMEQFRWPASEAHEFDRDEANER